MRTSTRATPQLSRWWQSILSSRNKFTQSHPALIFSRFELRTLNYSDLQVFQSACQPASQPMTLGWLKSCPKRHYSSCNYWPIAKSRQSQPIEWDSSNLRFVWLAPLRPDNCECLARFLGIWIMIDEREPFSSTHLDFRQLIFVHLVIGRPIRPPIIVLVCLGISSSSSLRQATRWDLQQTLDYCAIYSTFRIAISATNSLSASSI